MLHLLDRMPTSVTAEMRLDLIERPTWLIDDNGTELFRMRESWLAGSDERLIELALLPWSCGIGNSRAEAEELLAGRRDLQRRIAERLAEHDRMQRQ